MEWWDLGKAGRRGMGAEMKGTVVTGSELEAPVVSEAVVDSEGTGEEEVEVTWDMMRRTMTTRTT